MRGECARISERSPGPALTHARVGRGINKAVSHSRLVCVKSVCEKSNRSKLSEIVRSKETGVRVREITGSVMCAQPHTSGAHTRMYGFSLCTLYAYPRIVITDLCVREKELTSGNTLCSLYWH